MMRNPENRLDLPYYMAIRAALGLRDTVTEEDLRSSEQQTIAELIKKAEADNRNYVLYKDYDRKDPLQYQIENSLGRFNFSKDDEGNYTVVDNYDFMNPDRQSEAAKAQRAGMLTNIADFIGVLPETIMGAYKQTRGRDDVNFLGHAAFRLGEQYGNRFLNDITFPVNINLPRGMFSK